MPGHNDDDDGFEYIWYFNAFSIKIACVKAFDNNKKKAHKNSLNMDEQIAHQKCWKLSKEQSYGTWDTKTDSCMIFRQFQINIQQTILCQVPYRLLEQSLIHRENLQNQRPFPII